MTKVLLRFGGNSVSMRKYGEEKCLDGHTKINAVLQVAHEHRASRVAL